MSLTAKKFNAICFAFMLLLGLNFSIYQSIIQDINGFFGFDGAASGIMVALYFLGALIAPGPAGELGDRTGKKMVVILSGVLMFSCILLISQARHVFILGAGILLMGASGSTLQGLLSAKIADHNPYSAKRMMNFSGCCFCVGAVVGPLLSLAIKSWGGDWQTIMLINAVIFCPGMILLLWLPKDKKTLADKTASSTAYSLELIKDVRFRIFFISIVLYVGAEVSLAFSVTTYFTEAGVAAFGEIALSLFWAGMILGRLLAGVFHKRSDLIMPLCLVFGIIFSFLLQVGPPAIVSLVLFSLMGLSLSAVWPILMALCTQTFQRFSGTAGGLMIVGGSLGGILFPALVGVVSSGFGIRRALAIATASVALILMLNLLSRKNAMKTESVTDNPTSVKLTE